MYSHHCNSLFTAKYCNTIIDLNQQHMKYKHRNIKYLDFYIIYY